jgi:hypothetical protein
MPSETLKSGIPTGARNGELGRFCANIAEGLHAMAQPLTILRSTVAASAAKSVTPTRQRHYLDISTHQVERACKLFDCLQDLVIASKFEADCASFEIPELLALAVREHKAVLQASAVGLRVVTPTGLLPVLGDVSRTLQALSAALKIAASVSHSGDVIELLATARNGFVELVIQNRRAHGRPLNSSDHLSLLLAEANIRSQQGEHEYAEDPFRVRLTLPVQVVDP